MPARRAAALLLGATVLLAPGWAKADSVDPWVYAYAGLDHFYNLEYEEALADLQKAIASDPDNPFFYNFLANAYLFRELHRLGQLDANLYDASNAFLKEKKPEPDKEHIAKMKETLETVRRLCKARLAKNPRDVDALYSLGVAYGIEGNYRFTIERSWYAALKAGTKANELHEKVLKLDPEYHDAKLIPGVYQYVVGSIPRSVKWLAFLFGYRGSKVRGVRLLQEAMTKGRLVTSDAAILLVIIYNREDRHEYARRLLRPLSQYFPRNPLLRLEIGRSYLREGKQKEALEEYVTVAEDMEAGKPGYDQLPRERLWYQIGVLYQRREQLDEALDAYAHVTNRDDSDGLLRAYSGLRRGEIFLAQNRLEQARLEYERVAAMPYEEPRRQAKRRLQILNQ